MNSDSLVTRFAPSPTGLLHLGHAFSALTAFSAAQAKGGEFLLRLEDIDQGRYRPEFEDAIYRDLSWLGLSWETPVRRQSDHFADYEQALEKLREKNLVYRCFKTRKEITDEIARAPHFTANGPEGPAYIGDMLKAVEERALLSEGKPFAWRLSIAAAREYLGSKFGALSFVEEDVFAPNHRQTIKARPEIFGDVILARKDFATSYHLSSVYDDALQGITHVIRGDDLAPAAHLHTLLQVLLDLHTPIYRHHRLILNEDGKRLAKRDHAKTLCTMREAGTTIDEINDMLERTKDNQ